MWPTACSTTERLEANTAAQRHLPLCRFFYAPFLRRDKCRLGIDVPLKAFHVSSCPGIAVRRMASLRLPMCRASTPYRPRRQNVDGRNKSGHDGSRCFVTLILTIVPCREIKRHPAHLGDTFARVLSKVERERCLRAERHTPLPGDPGIDPAGITTGARGASLKRDARAKVTPSLLVA